MESSFLYVGAWLSLARAPGSGPGGRRFESSRPDQSFQYLTSSGRENSPPICPPSYVLPCEAKVRILRPWQTTRPRLSIQDPLKACAPQKVHTRLTQRFSRANTHGGVRRERQRVEPRGPQEYDADERSPARADVMPQGFPAQDSCAASRG